MRSDLASNAVYRASGVSTHLQTSVGGTLINQLSYSLTCILWGCAMHKQKQQNNSSANTIIAVVLRYVSTGDCESTTVVGLVSVELSCGLEAEQGVAQNKKKSTSLGHGRAWCARPLLKRKRGEHGETKPCKHVYLRNCEHLFQQGVYVRRKCCCSLRSL